MVYYHATGAGNVFETPDQIESFKGYGRPWTEISADAVVLTNFTNREHLEEMYQRFQWGGVEDQLNAAFAELTEDTTEEDQIATQKQILQIEVTPSEARAVILAERFGFPPSWGIFVLHMLIAAPQIFRERDPAKYQELVPHLLDLLYARVLVEWNPTVDQGSVLFNALEGLAIALAEAEWNQNIL